MNYFGSDEVLSALLNLSLESQVIVLEAALEEGIRENSDIFSFCFAAVQGGIDSKTHPTLKARINALAARHGNLFMS